MRYHTPCYNYYRVILDRIQFEHPAIVPDEKSEKIITKHKN